MSGRYLVPRPRYFRDLRIARVCPELVECINLAAWLWLADALRICILVPLWLIAISLHHLSEAVCWLGSMLPDFDARRQRVIRRANAIVPVDEVRRRLDALTEAKP